MISCRQITELPYANRLNLRAGKQGLSRPILWVHYLEVPEYTKWLKGGELIILSGAMLSGNENDLILLVRELYDRRAAGIVISLGRFIPHIPEKVIEEGDLLDLPIYELPPEVRIVDLSQSICFAIFQEKRRENMYSNTLMETIYGQRLTEKRIRALERAGFCEGKAYRSLAIRPKKEQKKGTEGSFYDEETAEALYARIEDLAVRYADTEGTGILHACDEDYIILLLPEEICMKNSFRDWIHRMLAFISEREQDVRLQAAVGVPIHSVRGIRDSVESAAELLEAGRASGEEILEYRNHILERILREVEDKAVLSEIVRNVFGALLEEENRELLETVQVFASSGCRHRETAEKLYIHKNTLYYRLKKAERILGQPLEDPGTMFEIQLCCRILMLQGRESLRTAEAEMPTYVTKGQK